MDENILENLKDLTRPQLNSHAEKNPDSNDFTVVIGYGGDEYEVSWFKDINVSNPQWSASAVKI